MSSGSIKEESPTNMNGLGSPFNCDVCNKPFKRKEHLFQHRKLHTGERPYVCTTCAKAFSRKEHLVRHLVSHTGQKMHECEVCGKSFSRKDNLHKHRKTHGMSGPYICETCGKSFVVKHYYLMHLTTHAPAVVDGLNCIQDPLPYKCDICHKAFSVKQYLTTHKLRHRSKSNSHTQNNSVLQEQQVQQANPSNELTITRDITSASMSNGTGHTANGPVIEIQGVVDRAEQQQQQQQQQQQSEPFVSSHYQGNVSQFQ
jgi:KRAB domain-containing zinc finger protein